MSKGLRIGVPRAFVSEGVDAEVRRAFDAALDTLRDAGASIVDIELPHARYAIPVYYLVCTAEASSNLARYDGVKYGYRSTRADTLKEMYSRTRDQGFGPEVKRRIVLGTYVLSAGYYDAFYLKAQQVRTLLRRDYDAGVRDGRISLRCRRVRFHRSRLGEKTEDPLQMYLGDVFTVSANLVGLPGISVPCGFATARRDAAADRAAADGPRVRGSDAAARGGRLRAGDALASVRRRLPCKPRAGPLSTLPRRTLRG